jgi:ribonuclease P protein component
LPQFAFGKRQRLLNGSDFKRVFTRAERSSDRYFTVLMRTSDLDHARLGLAIAKKQARRAVDRNRIKRIVRESFRHHQHRLDAMDIVVLARRDTAAATNEDLFNSLRHHWKRLMKKQASAQ